MSTNHKSMFNYIDFNVIATIFVATHGKSIWYVGTKKTSLQIMWFDHIETIMKYYIVWFTS